MQSRVLKIRYKFIGAKISFHKIKGFNSQRIGLRHQHRFIVFGTPIWRTWRHEKHSINRKKYCRLNNEVETLHNGHLGGRRKWPLWRGGRYRDVGVLNDNFLWSTTCFFVCLLCPIVMVIQSYVIYTKSLNYVLNQRCLRKKTSKIRNISFKHRRQFLLTAAV